MPASHTARVARMRAEDFWILPRRLLCEVLEDGYPIDPEALEGVLLGADRRHADPARFASGL